MRNICAQIIVHYRLPYSSLPNELDNGTFFRELLWQVAEKIDAKNPLVIVIDALDEINKASLPNRGILCLLGDLPNNVYVLASTRRQTTALLPINSDVKYVDMKTTSKENLENIKELIISKYSYSTNLQEWAKLRYLSIDGFVTLFAKQSEGNFMYLVLVLHEIARNPKAFDSVGTQILPKGLMAFYDHHWEQMRQIGDKFSALLEPVVCTLAVSREPVSIEMISMWTGISKSLVAEAIDAWREFLHEYDSSEPKTYRIYHLEFKNFLARKLAYGLEEHHYQVADSILNNYKFAQRKKLYNDFSNFWMASGLLDTQYE